ncbi:hypothetical protein DFH06DRAFT_1123490 [Mycena polygramma]|nr:hypothetical protein DFH06DRAFT_1123490 [Mycena polygramma]
MQIFKFTVLASVICAVTAAVPRGVHHHMGTTVSQGAWGRVQTVAYEFIDCRPPGSHLPCQDGDVVRIYSLPIPPLIHFARALPVTRYRFTDNRARLLLSLPDRSGSQGGVVGLLTPKCGFTCRMAWVMRHVGGILAVSDLSIVRTPNKPPQCDLIPGVENVCSVTSEPSELRPQDVPATSHPAFSSLGLSKYCEESSPPNHTGMEAVMQLPQNYCPSLETPPNVSYTCQPHEQLPRLPQYDPGTILASADWLLCSGTNAKLPSDSESSSHDTIFTGLHNDNGARRQLPASQCRCTPGYSRFIWSLDSAVVAQFRNIAGGFWNSHRYIAYSTSQFEHRSVMAFEGF